jgi:uncharacterized protein
VDREAYLRGIELFNRSQFYDAHEVLEDVWRAAPAEHKRFLQGLIQVAVAFHHHSTGNHIGLRSLLERSSKNLAAYPDEFGGVDVRTLLNALALWREALDQHKPLPPHPRIELDRAADHPGIENLFA